MKILILALLCVTTTLAFAQASPVSDTPTFAGLNVQQQLWLTWAIQGFKYLGELYSSVRAGGGLKRIILSVWLGEQTPKVVLDDYKEELKMEPLIPKKDEPTNP